MAATRTRLPCNWDPEGDERDEKINCPNVRKRVIGEGIGGQGMSLVAVEKYSVKPQTI